jgi:hypothetical protein
VLGQHSVNQLKTCPLKTCQPPPERSGSGGVRGLLGYGVLDPTSLGHQTEGWATLLPTLLRER